MPPVQQSDASLARYAIFTLDAEGRIVACNTEGGSLGGRIAGAAPGHHYTALLDADSEPCSLLDQAREAAGACPDAEGRFWMTRRDGQRFLAHVCVDAMRDAGGKPHGFAMTVRDTGLWRTADDLLRESERRFRLFVNSVSDHAICMLDPTGTVLDWNLGAQRITGFSSRAIVGHHFSAFFPERQQAGEWLPRLLRRARENGRAETECQLVRSDGGEFPAVVVLEAIQESDGSLLGYAKIMRDLTRQRLVEQRLHEVRKQVAHSQKVEALGQLTGGIAHDFNNALQGITSSLEVAALNLERESPGQAAHYVEMALNAAMRAGGLTQRLLSLARRQASANHRIPAQHVLQTVRELLERTLGDGIALRFELARDVPQVLCDGGQLESALVNLAVNARDAMAGQGELAIASRVCAADDPDLPVRLDPVYRTYLEIAVADDGPGMSEEVRQRAFEPFFTTKPEGEGTGLGLSMVYGFVTQYNGAIDIQSAPGEGTRVRLYLPCCAEKADPPHVSEARPEPDLSGYRVLMAEDNEIVRHSVTSRLRELGCQVLEAASGSEALVLLSEGQPCDLLLSDIDLPVLDGYELSRRARERFPHLRVILMTGYASASPFGGPSPDADTEILIKPFDMGALITKARLLLLPAG
jgi:PAS domain S-box-containing protein